MAAVGVDVQNAGGELESNRAIGGGLSLHLGGIAFNAKKDAATNWILIGAAALVAIVWLKKAGK